MNLGLKIHEVVSKCAMGKTGRERKNELSSE